MPTDTTTKQMALTRNVAFMERVTATMAYVAGSILSEDINTPHHQGRAQYAQRVVANPASTAGGAGPQIVMGINIVNTTTYNEDLKTSTCTATDVELQSQIQTLWNALGGLDTPIGELPPQTQMREPGMMREPPPPPLRPQ
jgi:hypothetical protein